MRKISNPFEGKQGYNCFGCCKDNPIGVHMDFYEDGDDIVSFWKPNGNYQGWVNVLHGGIQATLMDEIAGWVVFRKLQLTLRGRILKQVRNLVTVGVTLENSHGEICTEATALYYLFDEKKSKENGFVGCHLEGDEILL